MKRGAGDCTLNLTSPSITRTGTGTWIILTEDDVDLSPMSSLQLGMGLLLVLL